MERLLKDLGEALNRHTIPVALQPQIKKLLKEATKDMGSFVKPMTKKDEACLYLLRFDLVLEYTSNPCDFRNINDDVHRSNYYEADFEITEKCYGCKFCKVRVRSYAKWADFYEKRKLTYWNLAGKTFTDIDCENPFSKCYKGFFKKERALAALYKWLLQNYSLLEKLTEPNINYLKYIAQNISSRRISLCRELYKTCQLELINELMNYKIFRILCNQLTQDQC